MKKEHITIDRRINLQACIEKKYNLSKTAKILHLNPSSVYREIVKNCRIVSAKPTCAHCAKTCDIKSYKYDFCPDFVPVKCKKWNKFPYCCNGCSIAYCCRHEKHYYDCSEADEISFKRRSTPRQYKTISVDKIKIIDEITYKSIAQNGQSLHHCYIANPVLQDICSERTIRRFIYRGYLRTKPHNLPRFIRYEHKYVTNRPRIVNVERMLGRTFTDYLNYVKKNPDFHIWQYDSVEGTQSDQKAILTITYPKTRFQFGFLIAKKNSSSALSKIRYLQAMLGSKYKEIFQVNLSDNGSEFAQFHDLEFDKNGEFICKTFFTNPYRSTDKASCERNHEFIRYVLPKGKSLDFLTQEKVDLLFSHINSYIRESNQNKTPYQLMKESFGTDFLEAISIKEIPTTDVCLKRKLLD